MPFKNDKKKFKSSEKNGEKILYGVHDDVCFACGEKIKRNTVICPYCKTKIKLG